MKPNYNDIDELLVKFLTGEASGEEKDYVQQWLTQGEKNQQYYDHFRLIWEESLQLAATTVVDEQAAWQRFQQRTQQPAQKPATLRLLPAAKWVRIAATIIIVSGLSWMAWSLFNNNDKEVELATLQSTGAAKSDTLPDGSFITINRNSSLSWPQQFTGKQRNVQLTGEGFFNVTRDKQKPFIVHAGNNVIIEVLGTSFNVKSRKDSTEVIVETGNVQVSWLDKKVLLKAGEKVIIKNGQHGLHKQPVDNRLYNYYRSHTFICEETPLWKLVQVLNEAYDAHIIIENNSLRNLPLNVTFKNESLENILEIIRMTLAIDVIKEDGAIFLR